MDNQKYTPESIKVFIERNRKIAWESEYENDEYCIGENKVIRFCSDLLQENERQRKRIEELESENGSFVGLISTLADQIKKLEGLLNDVLADVQYADHKIDKDLRNEIKAALNL